MAQAQQRAKCARRVHAADRAAFILGAGVLLGLGGCASTNAANSPAASSSSHVSATATAPQSGASVLGGPAQAFITQYGPLTSQSNATQGDLHFKQYPGVATDYLIVQTGGYFAVTPGASDAYSIEVAPPPSADWTPSVATQACAPFLPADAQRVKQVITRDATSNATDGEDDIYMSATLAKTFPASAFQDANQRPAPAGSFDVWYLYTNEDDSSQIASCTLMVGEQQTKG